MSCIDTAYTGMKSIATGCERPIGGLKSIKFALLNGFPAATGGSVTVPAAKIKNIVFNTKDGATNFTEVLTNQPNGSSSIVPTIVTQLNGINKATRDALEELSNPAARLVLIAEDASGVMWCFGRKYGMICSQITSGTGANNADFNGYNVTFTGEEDEFAIPCTIGA